MIRGYEAAGLDRPPRAALVTLVRTRLGVDDAIESLQVASKLESRFQYERVSGLARELVREEEATLCSDLPSIVVGTGPQMLALPKEPRRGLLGALALEGHNVTVTARYKVGKSTLTENVAKACTTGGLFLARYPVEAPRRVAYLNYELDVDDMVDRIIRMGLDADALERLLVINLRGHRLPLTMPGGRDWLADRLLEHRAEVLVVDPFGAAFAAAGGDNENDNAEVRRFLIALDELKRRASCPSLFMPLHTGRRDQTEGDEAGRGATVVDDWADVRMILTKDDAGYRYLRTEGRAMDLEESRLGFQEGRLMLASSDQGVNRYRARNQAHLDAVVAAVKANPGMNTRGLRTALGSFGVKNTAAKDEARDKAELERLVHVHHKGSASLYYLGPSHPDVDDCPEGWGQLPLPTPTPEDDADDGELVQQEQF